MKERRDDSFGYRGVVACACFMLASAPFFFVMITQSHQETRGDEVVGSMTPLGWAAGLSYVVLLIAAIPRWLSPANRYRCGLCGAVAEQQPTDRVTGYEYRFYCSRCDVVWTTGVSRSDS